MGPEKDETRVTLALLMKVTLLVALDLGLLSDVAAQLLRIPFFAFSVAALNLVIVRAVFLGRPISTFLGTFLGVGAVSAVAFTALYIRWGNRWWQQGGAGVAAVALPWAAGLLAARLRRPGGAPVRGVGRSLATFAQGAILGFAAFGLVASLAYWAGVETPSPRSRGHFAYLLAALAFPTLGGAWLALASRRARPAPETGALS